MSARAVRRIVLLVCAAGIVGMITGSIAGSTGAALTFGLLTAVAVLCAMVATAVSTGGASSSSSAVDEAQAARVEQLVQALVTRGAEEDQVRGLVSACVRLGRGRRGTPGPSDKRWERQNER